MGAQLTPLARGLIAALLLAAALAGGWLLWRDHAERRVVTERDDAGDAVTRIVSARLAGMSQLKVAELSGTVQSRATDVRAAGLLRSDQVVKMPYSVGYFVDVARLGARDLEYSADTRTLVVNAPDVIVGKPNTDEGERSLVETSGLFVTRAAGEELARRTSRNAQAAATREANAPERLAQAREHARRALAGLLAAPLEAAGEGRVRVIVTFPFERGIRDGERWDVSTPLNEVAPTER